jgi:hypothetical protein
VKIRSRDSQRQAEVIVLDQVELLRVTHYGYLHAGVHIPEGWPSAAST